MNIKMKTIGKRSIGSLYSMALILALCLMALGGMFITCADSFEAVSENLLVNPDWENGIEGWTAKTVNEEAVFKGEQGLCSSVGQDVALDDTFEGQLLRLSGKIAVSSEDPTQERIDLGIVLLGEDETYIYSQTEYEEGSEPAYHEIFVTIPEGTACARVYLTIWKNSKDNQMYFSDLKLEAVEKPAQEEYPVFRSEGV